MGSSAIVVKDQAHFEQSIQDIFDLVNDSPYNPFDKVMDPKLVYSSLEEKRIIFEYTPQPWMTNPGGILHGGMISTMLDSSMGFLSASLGELAFAPTASINLNFLSTGRVNDKVYVEVKCTKFGRSLVFCTAKAWQDDENEPMVCAEGVYVNTKVKTAAAISREQSLQLK